MRFDFTPVDDDDDDDDDIERQRRRKAQGIFLHVDSKHLNKNKRRISFSIHIDI